MECRKATSEGRDKRRPSICAAFVTALFGLAGTVWSAPPIELEDTVSASELVGSDLEIAASGRYVYAVWEAEAASGEDVIYFARSTDAGDSFGSVTTIRSTGGQIAGVIAPAIAASGSHVFIVWVESVEASSVPTYELTTMIRISSDNGATFGLAKRVDTAATPASVGSSDPSVAAVGDRVYVAYSGVTDNSPDPAEGDLLLRVSENAGATFGDVHDFLLFHRPHGTSLAASGDHVYVAYWGGLDYGFRRSTDGGASFEPEVSLEGVRADLAASSHRVYLLVEDANGRVKIRSSVDHGASFGAFVTIDGSVGGPRQSTLAATGSLVGVAWRQSSDDTLRFRSSGDGGVTFAASRVVASGFANFEPSLATVGTRFHILWRGTWDGGWHMLTRRTKVKPVIFVPGVGGTILIERNSDTELWPGVGVNHDPLSLHPADSPEQFDIVATELLREVLGGLGGIYYGPFLDFLSQNARLHSYELEDESQTFVPERLTEAGCDLTQRDDGPTPDLFVFPYDWRRNNIINAGRLSDYIGCVRLFYPDTDVNLVTHSMGSLIARRYILDQGSSQHHLARLITIGAPWLGAPKMPHALDTGDLFPHLLNSTSRRLVGSFESAHQLMPSRAYTQELSAMPPWGEAGRDLDGDGVDNEIFSHDRMTTVADTFGDTFTPGTTSEVFHSHPGQDDWSSDTRDIDYYHVYGVQSTNKTIGQALAKWRVDCGGLCRFGRTSKITWTSGDGTVPTISARRINGPDLNDDQRTLCRINSSAPSDDNLAEHNGMMSNPVVQNKVIEYLFGERATTAVNDCDEPSPGGDTTGATQAVAQHELTITGAESVVVRDDEDNELLVSQGQILGTIPGVAGYRLGDEGVMILLPSDPSYSYTVGVVVGDGPMAIGLTTGTSDETTRILRYLDLDLTTGRAASLSVAGPTISDLTYDSTGDGVLDAVVPPTVDVSGAEAEDTTPPLITVDLTPAGHQVDVFTVTVEAIDAVSGPATAYTSLDGSQYQEVTGPFEVDATTTNALWVWADDAVGNRAVRAVAIAGNAIFADSFETGGYERWLQGLP